MELASFVLGLIGTVLATASVVWQFAQHQLTGPRVRVDLRWGGLTSLGSLTGPLSSSLETFQAAGVTRPMFAVVVRNVGRTPIDIQGYGVAVPNGARVSQPGNQFDPRLPHRLEGGSQATFHVQLELVQGLVAITAAAKERAALRAVVDLGSGATRRGAWEKVPRSLPTTWQ